MGHISLSAHLKMKAVEADRLYSDCLTKPKLCADACVCARARVYVCVWTETRTPDTTVQILAQTLPKMAHTSVFK